MADADTARLTAAEGRRFAWTLGVAFGVIAAILTWRGRSTAAGLVAAIAALLFLAGLVVPRQLGPVERAWMALARAISRVTTPVFMGVIYFLLLTPTGLLRRALGRGTVRRSRRSTTFWVRRPAQTDAAALRRRMERQF